VVKVKVKAFMVLG